MFERYTARAKRVIVLGQEEARALKHNYIGTEHLLLGLIYEAECPEAKILAAAGVTRESVIAFLDEEIGRGAEEVPDGNLKFTPRSMKVLNRALRESLELQQQMVTPAHILLGLLYLSEGFGFRMLIHHGCDSVELRRDVIASLATSKEQLLQQALEQAQENVLSVRRRYVIAQDLRDEVVQGGDPGIVQQAHFEELGQLLYEAESLRDLLVAASSR